MTYRPLYEILTDLDAQQRRELTELSSSVDQAELERIRHARKQLATVAVFFIERSWGAIAPQLEAFSLEMETGKSSEELKAYLNKLHRTHPAYAWGWTRARMNARLMQLLEAWVPELLRQNPEMAALYQDSLRQVDAYWFRETPLHHLKTGYHTALAVSCKWYGAALELQKEARPSSCSHAMPHFSAELRQFASFSLTMLHRTDRYLWDSAGAEPLDAVWESGTLKIAHKAIEEISPASAPDYGLRLGCPALRARRQSGTPAFQGIVEWVEQVFSRHLSAEE